MHNNKRSQRMELLSAKQWQNVLAKSTKEIKINVFKKKEEERTKGRYKHNNEIFL